MKTFRNILLAAAFSLSVAACSSTGQIVNPFAGGTINTTAVQNAAVAACGFLPTAATVSGIISAATGGVGGAALQTAEQVAAAICAAVLPTKSGKLRGTPMVNGVAVHGRWVN